MIQNFFSGLYELVLGRPLPANYTNDYREVVFPNTGLQLFIITLALVVVYYYVLNRLMSTGLYKTRHWVIVLLLNAALAFAIPLIQVNNNDIETHSYTYMFAFVNTIYSLILFFVFSLLLKRGSVQAWTTPTKWPN
jgi:phosphotransferase system  glucose/maltose/N-acetylglucosamine-specific IIC component